MGSPYSYSDMIAGHYSPINLPQVFLENTNYMKVILSILMQIPQKFVWPFMYLCRTEHFWVYSIAIQLCLNAVSPNNFPPFVYAFMEATFYECIRELLSSTFKNVSQKMPPEVKIRQRTDYLHLINAFSTVRAILVCS